MEERWLPIPDFEKIYEFSDRYRVRRIERTTAHNRFGEGGERRISEKMLSVSQNNGYLVAYLCKTKSGNAKKFYVEAAVENAFPDVVPNRFDGISQPGEQWKEIAGYEGLYEVSNFGRVRSVGWYVNGGAKRRYARPSLRKSSVNATTGYPKVELTVKGKTKSHMIHRLVACAFVDNPLGLDTVHHKDENRLNPRSENLEWTTRAGNIQDWFNRRRVVVSTDTITQIAKAIAAGHTPAEILAALPRKRKAGKI